MFGLTLARLRIHEASLAEAVESEVQSDVCSYALFAVPSSAWALSVSIYLHAD